MSYLRRRRWILVAIPCLAPLLFSACVSMEPYRYDRSVVLDEKARKRLFEAHNVKHPGYMYVTLGGKLLPSTQWGELEQYYAASGDTVASMKMKQWNSELPILNTFGLVGAALIVVGSSQQDQPSLAGPLLGIGAGSMLAAIGTQIHSSATYLGPAAEHFDNFMKKDLDLTGTYDNSQWKAVATLRIP